jgi:hypothetical protein
MLFFWYSKAREFEGTDNARAGGVALTFSLETDLRGIESSSFGTLGGGLGAGQRSPCAGAPWYDAGHFQAARI